MREVEEAQGEYVWNCSGGAGTTAVGWEMCMVGRVGWRGEAGQRIGYREGSRGMEEQRVLVQVGSVAMYEMGYGSGAASA